MLSKYNLFHNSMHILHTSRSTFISAINQVSSKSDQLSCVFRSIVFSKLSAVESFLKKVNEFQKTEDFSIIERLTDENVMLWKRIIFCHSKWKIIVKILQEIFDTFILLKTVLEDCSNIETETKESWIAAMQSIEFQQFFEHDKHRNAWAQSEFVYSWTIIELFI